MTSLLVAEYRMVLSRTISMRWSSNDGLTLRTEHRRAAPKGRDGRDEPFADGRSRYGLAILS